MINLFERIIDTVRAHFRLRRQALRSFSRQTSNVLDQRILLLASEFAPSTTGGVFRPAAFARYASELDWKVTVVTNLAPKAPTAAGLQLLETVGSDVRIERFSPSPLEPSYRFFTQIDGGMLQALDMVDATRICFEADVPHTIVATGPPFCSFVAGFMLACQYGSCLVVEYRDEWTECPFDFVSKEGANYVWERRCLDRADQIVMTTESQKAHLIESFGSAIGEKCVVVPNGWDPSPQEEMTRGICVCDHRTVLTFAGKLGGHTDPSRFLGTLLIALIRQPSLRQQVLFRFVGSKSDGALKCLKSFPFQEVIELVPVVPLAEARRMLHDSDALIMFHDPRFERYLPGKAYEYAASGTPIILFDDTGETHHLVTKFDLGWSLHSGDVEMLTTVLSQLVDKHSMKGSRAVRSVAFAEWLESHKRKMLVRQFLEGIPR